MDNINLDQMIHKTVEKYLKKTLIVAANWKMNMTICEGIKFLETFGTMDGNVLIFPSYITLAALALEFRKKNIFYGPQNFHYEDKGAYTGEISIPMIQELGCDYLLVGHSERRKYYNETDENIRRKIQKGIHSDLKVLLCIGENLKERKDSEWKKVLEKQLVFALIGLNKEELQSVLVAYEPVWAIGTGISASLEEIIETHRFLKQVMKEKLGCELPLLYGGSVNEKNAFDIGSCWNVDGFLVGGASLNPDTFKKIIEISKRM